MIQKLYKNYGINLIMDQLKNFENLSDRPGHLIRRLHQIHVAMFLNKCSDFNLTPVQFGILTVLADQSNYDQVKIATRIGVDRNTAADVIRRLEKRGLIERPDHPADKRTKLAKITDDGKDLVEKVYPAMIDVQVDLVKPLTNEEYLQYMNLTRKLIEANDHSSRAPWNNN